MNNRTKQSLKHPALAEQQEPGRNHYEDGDVFERIAAMKRRTAQPQPQPVGYVAENGVVDWNVCAPPIMTDLFTSPPAQREPLTDDELTYLWYNQSTDWMEFARAIEAAHGIKENT